MAMLNIGLLIFGATYAFLPELSGKALYSEKLAWIHFLDDIRRRDGGIRDLADPGPRRRTAALGRSPVELRHPRRRVSLPLVFVLAAAQGLFFWNVLQTLRGKGGVATFDERGIPRPSEKKAGWSEAAAGSAIFLAIVFLVVELAAGAGYLVGHARGNGGGSATTPTTTTTAGPAVGDPAAGAKVFASAGCGGCARTRSRPQARPATSAPSSPGAKLPAAVVAARVRTGKGAMPPFAGRLNDQQIADIAAYVHESSQK